MILAMILIIISIVLICFFIWKHRYIKRLKEIRDNFDFTTPEGKFLIKCYNRKINQLNGKLLWKNQKIVF
jgi:hypothetical protein